MTLKNFMDNSLTFAEREAFRTELMRRGISRAQLTNWRKSDPQSVIIRTFINNISEQTIKKTVYGL